MKDIGAISKIIPPTIEEVRIYFNQKGINYAEANDFFLFYESKKLDKQKW